ncbi:hypothetical protein [Halopelagius fulvigenes]|uniref:PH domain-containing protein n=1 Tax=Halopelagius fulvigenes TaxID=1198324 RepID=A0ABD5TYF5_9EURY
MKRNETPLFQQTEPWMILTEIRLLWYNRFLGMERTSEIRLGSVTTVEYQIDFFDRGRLILTGPGIARKEWIGKQRR